MSANPASYPGPAKSYGAPRRRWGPRRVLADWHPGLGVQEQVWLEELERDGWTIEYGPGEIKIGGVAVRRYALVESTG